MEQNWKNYYQILQVSPNAEPRVITKAYQRLARLSRHTPSDKTKGSQISSVVMADLIEAYEVLSDPARRAVYDRIFRAKYKPPEMEAEELITEEIANLMQLVAQDVSKKEGRKKWRVLGWSKLVQEAIVIAVISLLSIGVGGTSFAFAQPQHTLATPFKGVAITLTEASAEAISLIEDVRRVAAAYERNIVSSSVQAMRVTEGLNKVPLVTISTNDMAGFPSMEHPLFPDYLDKRFSQFKYTVDRNGTVSVDTSGATTDALLEKIEQLLNQLTGGK